MTIQEMEIGDHASVTKTVSETYLLIQEKDKSVFDR